MKLKPVPPLSGRPSYPPLPQHVPPPPTPASVPTPDVIDPRSPEQIARERAQDNHIRVVRIGANAIAATYRRLHGRPPVREPLSQEIPVVQNEFLAFAEAAILAVQRDMVEQMRRAREATGAPPPREKTPVEQVEELGCPECSGATVSAVLDAPMNLIHATYACGAESLYFLGEKDMSRTTRRACPIPVAKNEVHES